MARTKKSGRKIAGKPVWLKYTEQEIKDIIASLVKKQPELTAEKIGLILRDAYGIPKTRIYGFRIGSVLRELNVYSNPDIKNLAKKVEKLDAHALKNKQDKKVRRALIVAKSKLKKVKDYLER